MPTFKIISFDGGGIKGALSTRIIKRLFIDNPELLNSTDLFAGTSTGALISLTLAYGLKCDEVDNLYNYENIKRIFTPRRLNLLIPRFNNKRLKQFITSVIPEKTLLSDLKKLVFIPAFNVKGVSKKSWQGVFFNNINNNFTTDEKVLDVALASSAAPTYFPSHMGYIDGGLITNAPAFASVLTVMHENPGKYKFEDFRVLSIGTGETPRRITSNTTNWGTLQWALRPFCSVKLPLLSVLLNDTIPLEELYCKELLKGNYHRINPLLFDDVEIDDYRKVPGLKETADNYNLNDANYFIKNVFFKD